MINKLKAIIIACSLVLASGFAKAQAVVVVEDYAQNIDTVDVPAIDSSWWASFLDKPNYAITGGVTENTSGFPWAFGAFKLKYKKSVLQDPFRQLAAIESPGGSKLTFEKTDVTGVTVKYEVSPKLKLFDFKIAAEYKNELTLKIGWEKELPDDHATYNAIATESIITDYYDGLYVTSREVSVIELNLEAQKHNKVAVRLYRDGVPFN